MSQCPDMYQVARPRGRASRLVGGYRDNLMNCEYLGHTRHIRAWGCYWIVAIQIKRELDTYFPPHGARLAVRGSRFAVRGSRFAVRGSRFAVRGERLIGKLEGGS